MAASRFPVRGIDAIINEVKNLGLRLAGQTDKPALLALAGEVTAFYAQLNAARNAQQGLEGSTDITAEQIEAARVTIARALYGDLGMLMAIYQDAPSQVEAFFDLDTLREGSSGAEDSSDQGTDTPPSKPAA